MRPLSRHLHRARGVSLVELMVALTIGLIILAAISTLFAGTKQTYNVQDSLARLQENARFAMQSVVKDIRLAGFFGCLGAVDPGPPGANADTSVESSNLRFAVAGGTTFTTNPFIPIEGVDNGAGTWSPSGSPLPAGILAGTDALTVRLADPTALSNVTAGMINGASVVPVTSAAPFAAGDIVVVSDCAFADVMYVTGIAGNTLQHAIGAPGNVSIGLKKAYVPPAAAVYKIKTRQYFIKTNPNNVASLFVQDNNGAPTELVEGIENMQILYGEDTDSPPDGVPNIYRTAGNVTDWTKVMSVRIGILAKTIESKDTDTDTATYDVNGTSVVAPGDHARRRVFQTVVQLRNTQ